jgi:hypothetical protein
LKYVFVSYLVNTKAEAGIETLKKTAPEVPPPGVGFVTVMEAVPVAAMSVAGIAAVRRELLTKVVGRGLPFQFTTEVETKPVPFTVSVNPGPPGPTLGGTRGVFIRGTRFA